jgi:hypothetical protein
MYNDVKMKLKNVAKDLDLIKSRLAHGGDLYRININKESKDIDEEDKQFVLQNFTLEPDPISAERRATRVNLSKLPE